MSDVDFLPELLSSHQVFPIAYGNEEETGMLDNTSGRMDEPYMLAESLRQYVPADVLGNDTGEVIFLRNGFKLYPGGASGASRLTNIERATPECSSPRQLVRYMRASELLLTNVVGKYLTEETRHIPGEVKARLQRRVVDSAGSRKACHDNFGITPESKLAKIDHLPAPVLAHLATRNFITGAGHVRGSGLQYAQKVRGLRRVHAYGYFGSMYRTTKNEGTPRIEVRCSDINISDWAATMRIGGTALSIALNQTPLGNRLIGIFPEEVMWRAKDMNHLKLRRDGRIQSTAAQEFAADFQQASAEMVMAELHRYTDEVPSDMLKIADEIYNFCEDYKNVLSGNATIELLADRADWAAKMLAIQRGIAKDQKFGIRRYHTDIKSRAADMRYDYIGMSAENGRLHSNQYGTGYKLRDRGMLKGETITADEVMFAYRRPPSNTRAALRSSLLRNYNIINCDWHSLQVIDGDKKHTVDFENVLQTELTNEDKSVLSDVKQLRA